MVFDSLSNVIFPTWLHLNGKGAYVLYICGKNIYKLIKCLDSVSMMIKHIGNLSVECQTCCETSAINMADLMTLLIAKNDTLIIQPNNEIAYKYLP